MPERELNTKLVHYYVSVIASDEEVFGDILLTWDFLYRKADKETKEKVDKIIKKRTIRAGRVVVNRVQE